MRASPQIEIVTLAERPDLAPIVAEWLWRNWDRRSGYTYDQTLAYVTDSSAGQAIPQTFVLLVDEQPVGTSSFVAADMKERPDLTPWMASVYVAPEARHRGHVIPLIHAVEAAATAAGILTMWLHTDSAARIYAKAGWRTVEVVQRDGGETPATLMRRDLLPVA
jgi:N-acetylglutamate synthase-like GNAT family acetyltransferase